MAKTIREAGQEGVGDVFLELPRGKKWPLGLRWFSLVCSHLCPKVPGELFGVKV